MVDDADLFRTAWRRTGAELLRHLRCVGYSEALTPDHRWYCAQLHPGCDFLAAMLMIHRGFTLFLPLMETRTPDGLHADPLFPGYVFVAVNRNTEELLPRIRVNGFRQLVGGGVTGRPIQAGIVETLIEQSGGDRIIRAAREAGQPEIKAGDQVRVLNGPFQDLTGVVDLPGKQRVHVLLSVLGRPVPVELRRDMVQPA